MKVGVGRVIGLKQRIVCHVVIFCDDHVASTIILLLCVGQLAGGRVGVWVGWEKTGRHMFLLFEEFFVQISVIVGWWGVYHC